MQETPFLRAERAKKRGTNIINDKPCQKCKHPNAIYYYMREISGKAKPNGCVWCAYISNTEPAPIKADVVEVKENGVLVYQGRACRKCGSKEHLAVKAFGAKANACYECSIQASSDKAGKTQISRQRQQIKKATNKFIIQSIERSGTVEVAPETLSDYYLVRSLIEERDRLNEISDGSRKWEIGHRFPASGGGTEYRGKATVNNLALVEKRINRSEGDNLPIDWTIAQVIYVGEMFTSSISSTEAAIEWRKRMGWDSITSTEKKAHEVAEAAENAKFKQRVGELSARLVSVAGGTSSDDEWRDLVDKVERRIDLINRKCKTVIKNAMKQKQSIYVTEDGLTEEALLGLNARYRIIYNTLKQLIEIVEKEEAGFLSDPFDELPDAAERNIAYCAFLSESTIVKRAFLLWAEDTLKTAKYDVQGFTHPLLNKLNKAYVWGTKTGDDGRQWLCGWLVTENGEQIEQNKDNVASWVSVPLAEFRESEQQRKDTVKDKMRALVGVALQWLETNKNIQATSEIDTSNFYDAADAEKHIKIIRDYRTERASKEAKAFQALRDSINAQWDRMSKQSAQDVENWLDSYAEKFSRYQEQAIPCNPMAFEYSQHFNKSIKEDVY